MDDFIVKQLVGGMPDLARRLQWWIDNFKFRISQAVGRLRAGTTSLAGFQQFGWDELRDAYYGIAETGKGAHLTAKEMAEVRRTLRKQRGYWDRFCQDIADQYKDLEQRGLEGKELDEAYDALHDKFDRRAQSYAGAMEAEGQRWAMARLHEDGQWFVWRLSVAEHCETCLKRKDAVAQMRDGRLPYYPKDGSTVCLYNCLCRWEPISRIRAAALRALGKLRQVVGRKSFEEVAREELEKLRKGGPGSGWFAPPRGTHGPGSMGGKVREKTAKQMRGELKRDLKRKTARKLELRVRGDDLARQHGNLMAQLERLRRAGAEEAYVKDIKEEAKVLWDKLGKNEKEYWAVARSIREGAYEKLKVANPADFETNMGKLRKGREELQEGVDAFAGLVGRGSLDGRTITMYTTGGKRGHYDRDGVYLPPLNRRKAVVVHELGHWLEDRDSDAHAKAVAFLEERTKGERAVSLQRVTDNPSYRSWETTKKNKFLNPYMGKQYGRAKGELPYATEIISMGIEYMYREPFELAEKDPEYFDFMYDLMRGK